MYKKFRTSVSPRKITLQRGALHYFICIAGCTSIFSSDVSFILKNKSQLYILSNKQYVHVQQYRGVVGTRSFVALLLQHSVLHCTGILLSSGRCGSWSHLCTPGPSAAGYRSHHHASFKHLAAVERRGLQSRVVPNRAQAWPPQSPAPSRRAAPPASSSPPPTRRCVTAAQLARGAPYWLRDRPFVRTQIYGCHQMPSGFG